MRNLIPTFILDQMAQGNHADSLPAVVLFVDTSGFTPLTVALMQHGAEGAEIIAGVLDAVFTPLVEIIYAQGGFIAGFAGDAFKAIFPIAVGDAHRRAILAAWHIRQQMAQHPTQTTRFGVFAFEVKVCVADGEVEWEVWQGDDTSATQRAAYVFAGPALATCLEADPYAAAGEVLVTRAVYDQLRPWGIAGTPAAAYWRLTDVPATWLPGSPAPARAEPVRDEAVASIFYPPDLPRLHTRGEFRQVVTVFINLQTLPTGADAFASALFRLLARDGGYLCRVGQIGDRDRGATLLLFWGAPISYEHDVVRALNFVVDLQAAAPTPFRAGITTNLVYAGFVGSALREEYTCYGSHVNLAARQMVMAEWGEIWLDGESARLASAEFEIVPHARFRFKGFAEERPVFRLIGRHATPPATFYSGAMIGRQHELAQLQAAVQPIVAGHFGGVVIITGEAGIGKSRLVHELQQSVAHSPPSDAPDAGIRTQDAGLVPQWFLGQTDELLRQSLDPFRYWLRSYFTQSTTASEAVNKHAFNTKLDDLIAFLTADHRTGTVYRAPITGTGTIYRASTPDARHALADELDRTRSFLGALVDLHWPDSLYAQLEPQLRFENTLGALKTLILAESLRRPAILHLEDAHWLDADSRTLLARLTHRVDGFPFAVVITMRPPSETGQAGAQAEPLLPSTVQQVMIPLAALAPSDLRTLAADVLADPVAPELVALVRARSEGNPFFAEQMLRYLQEQGLLERGAAGWQVRADLVESTILPGEARSVLIARLDRLTQAVKEVVQTAAVLGREFAVQVLSRMLHNPLSLSAHLRAAEDAAIWLALSQLRYLFKHALLRDAAYDMQLRARLRALHQLAAQSIQQLFAPDLAPHYATLAYHTEQAGLLPEAAGWYKQAGEQTAAQYANQSAIAHFSKALALTPESEVAARRDILLARVDVLNLLGDRNAEERDLDMLQMLAQHMADPSFQAQVAVRRMDYAWGTSNYAAVEALAPTAIALAQAAQDAQSEGRSHYIWGVTLRYQGVFDAAREQFEQAHQIALATGNRRAEAYALLGLGSVARERSAYSTAMSNYEQVLRIARETGEHRLEATILHSIALALSDQGRYAESEHVLKEGLRVARAIGDRHREGKDIDLLSDSALARRDVAQAEEHLNAALDILREVNDRDAQAWVFDNLGEISCYQGNHTRAMAYLEQSRSILLSTGQLIASFPLCHLAAVVTALGDYGLARAQLDEALEICRSIGHQWTEGEALVTLSVLCYAQGEDELAHHYADQAVAINQASRNRSEEMSARAYQGHILARMGHLDAAAASYQQVLERKQEWWGKGEPDIFSLTGFLHGLAGLAHLASLRQGWEEAYPYAEELLRDLTDVPLDLRLNPQLIYLICYRVLRAAGDPRAQCILTTAYHRMQTQAANIADEALRRSFLENVAEHRELAAEFAQLG